MKKMSFLTRKFKEKGLIEIQLYYITYSHHNFEIVASSICCVITPEGSDK